MSQQITIIGGGVIGCFLAYRLSLEGASITLLEKDSQGAGASGASAGNVQPVTGDNIAFECKLGAESLALYRKYLPLIKAESGIDFREQDTRYLYAATTENEERELRDMLSHMRSAGLRVEWVDSKAVKELDPRLSPDVIGGMLHQDCMQMDPQLFVDALALAAQRKGAKFVIGEAQGLESSGGRVSGVTLADGTVLPTESVIVSTGPWSGQLLKDWLDITLPIEPCGLQKLHLKLKTGGAPLGCAVRWGGVNIVQRVDGLIHAGSKRDPNAFEATPNDESRDWLLQQVRSILPGLEMEVAEARAGCAALIPDRVPLLGPIPGIDGAHMAVPSTDGFLLAAVLAEMLTTSILKGEQHPMLEQMLPARAVLRR